MTTDTTQYSGSMLGQTPGTYLPVSLNPHGYQSLTDILAVAVKKYADRPAFTSVGRTITYKELNDKSDQFAAYLQNETDLIPGDRIAVQLP